jgi:hypothetical protein
MISSHCASSAAIGFSSSHAAQAVLGGEALAPGDHDVRAGHETEPVLVRFHQRRVNGPGGGAAPDDADADGSEGRGHEDEYTGTVAPCDREAARMKQTDLFVYRGLTPDKLASYKRNGSSWIPFQHKDPARGVSTGFAEFEVIVRAQ